MDIKPKIYSLQLSINEINLLSRVLWKAKNSIQENEVEDEFAEEMSFILDLINKLDNVYYE